METLTDEQLLIEYRNGAADRFELLVRRCSQELFHFLYRLLGSPAAAEDIVQETLLQVHLSADRFDAERKFKPWVFTIAANKARDYLRSQKRRPEVPLHALTDPTGGSEATFADLLGGSSVSPSLRIETEERSRNIRKLVSELPAPLKEVLILGYYHGFAYREMAEILDVPIGTIKSRLHSAVAKLGLLLTAARSESDELVED
ncbi:MAG: sigma-70 family RNA polymerase sigma factor [Planctomycetes bacterium]|nr:sigma-70 family RNA polymerase sigma factor [Planctomycetota bacterium]